MTSTYQELCTLHDGSRLRTMSAKELTKVPIWNGNRIIDMIHVQKIKDGIRGHVQKLDFGYRVARVMEMDAGFNPITASYVIDGQHRHKVLCDHFESLCESDFPVVVLEKDMKSEAEIISYFNEVNCQKPIEWKTDPKMLANVYVDELYTAFNSGKKKFIRHGSTQRPYLSVDALRDAFIACDSMKDSRDEVIRFVQRALEYNKKKQKDADMDIYSAKKDMAEKIQKAANIGFMLALDPKLPWVRECLRV